MIKTNRGAVEQSTLALEVLTRYMLYAVND